MPISPAERRRRVFLNCPFDDSYEDLLRAAVFAIAACGYAPVCALEDDDAGRIRFQKLIDLVATCDLSIHDLSRVELDGASGLPRFNMPFELGLTIGAKHLGTPSQRGKRLLVVARRREEWSPAISDLAGIDPTFHGGDARRLMRAVRDFLHQTPTGSLVPGEAALARDYERFRRSLPAFAEAARQTEPEALRYKNYVSFLRAYLALDAA